MVFDGCGVENVELGMMGRQKVGGLFYVQRTEGVYISKQGNNKKN